VKQAGPRPEAYRPNVPGRDPRALDRAQRAPISRAQPVKVNAQPVPINRAHRAKVNAQPSPVRHQNPRSWTPDHGPRSPAIRPGPPDIGSKTTVFAPKNQPETPGPGSAYRGL